MLPSENRVAPHNILPIIMVPVCTPGAWASCKLPGLEPAYKDGYDLPLRGMMKQHCFEIGRVLTGSDPGIKGTHFPPHRTVPQTPADVLQGIGEVGAALKVCVLLSGHALTACATC